MSKQDRQGVRKAADIEQKYGLGQFMYKQNKSNQDMSKGLSNLGESLSAYKEENNKAFEDVLKDVSDIYSELSNLQKNLESMNTSLKKYWQTVYPVGAIYISVSATSPQTLFGGTWEQIQDRFLLASGSSYKAGATGGEANHTLTVNEIPSHDHTSGNTPLCGNIGYGDSAGTQSGFTVGWGNVSSRTDLNIRVKSVGGSKPHNNMPPYLAVNVWKRTA